MTENMTEPGSGSGKKVWLIIGVVVVLLAVVLFIKFGGSKPKQESGPLPKDTVKSNVQRQTLKELIANNANRQCTFSEVESGATTKGNIFIGGGKMRGDFEGNENGKAMVSHMITDSSASYVWMEGEKTGFKISVNEADGNRERISENSIDPNKQKDFTCNPWTVDSGKFVLPANIEFSDMSAMMKNANPSAPVQGQSAPGSAGIDMKAACNGLQEPNKSQCLKALGQ